MEREERESPEFRRWREEALPPSVAEAVEEIRKNPDRENILRLLNETTKKALRDLITLLERQPTRDEFIFYAAVFVSTVNQTLPEISDYVAAIVNFGRGGGGAIGAVEKRFVKSDKPLKGLVLFIDLPNAARDDQSEFTIEPS